MANYNTADPNLPVSFHFQRNPSDTEEQWVTRVEDKIFVLYIEEDLLLGVSWHQKMLKFVRSCILHNHKCQCVFSDAQSTEASECPWGEFAEDIGNEMRFGVGVKFSDPELLRKIEYLVYNAIQNDFSLFPLFQITFGARWVLMDAEKGQRKIFDGVSSGKINAIESQTRLLKETQGIMN